MKKLYYFIFTAILVAFSAQAQDAKTVTMGAGYANDVFYSLEDGVAMEAPRNNWHIGFTTQMFDFTIFTNDVGVVKLKQYASGNINDWATVDTTGYSTWPLLYNNDSVWEEGSFSRGASGHPDYGWGIYNNVTHDLTGDSIYIIEIANGDEASIFKKLKIDKLLSMSVTFNFTYADLDGSNEQVVSLVAKNYATKNYVYYSLTNNEIVDREAASDSWDMLFTRWISSYYLEQDATQTITGVQTNLGTKGWAVNFELGAEVSAADTTLFNESRLNIGGDWKKFSMATFTYSVVDTVVYYARSQADKLYELKFTAFDYTTGTFEFTQELIEEAGGVWNNEVINTKLKVYPQPAKGSFTIALPANQSAVEVYNLAGQQVFSQVTSGNKLQVSTSNWNSGIYVLKAVSGNTLYSQKLIVE